MKTTVRLQNAFIEWDGRRDAHCEADGVSSGRIAEETDVLRTRREGDSASSGRVFANVQSENEQKIPQLYIRSLRTSTHYICN